MTAATLTAAAAADDLIGDLRRLLDRHEGASTLDDVRQLADELSGMLGRTRGRIRRLARQAGPAGEPAQQPETKPAADKPEPSRFDPATLGRKTTRAAEPAAEPAGRPAGPAPARSAVQVATASLRRMALPAARAIRERTSGDRKNPAPAPRPSPPAAAMPPPPRPHRRPAVTTLIILVAAWMLGAELVALAGEGLVRAVHALERTGVCLFETWRSSRCRAIVSSLRRGRRP